MGKEINKLGDLEIKALLKAGKPAAKADGGGLTFTLSTKGAASWVLRYRFGGKPRELTLGRYPDLTLAKARDMASEKRLEIRKGVDVARELQKEKAQRASARNFRELAGDYMVKRFPRLAPRTVAQRRQHIEGLILPRLGTMNADEIGPHEIVALLEKVGRGSIHVAELVFTALNEIMKHGQARHVITANPCAGLSVSAICGQAPAPRKRLMLTADELRLVLPALPGIGTENALAVKILLATCVRLGELVNAQWQHVDLDGTASWSQPNGDPIHAPGPKWLIPIENSKTGKTTGKHFVIPLAPAAVDWFRALQVLACGSAYVLPARQANRRQKLGGDAPCEQRAINAMLHKLCDRLDGQVRRFTPHDLRSTARSHLTAMGVNVALAERCLNHSLGGLIGVYDQHDYLEGRRAALAKWTDLILACEAGQEWVPTGSNVIPIGALAA